MADAWVLCADPPGWLALDQQPLTLLGPEHPLLFLSLLAILGPAAEMDPGQCECLRQFSVHF